jgi:DNA repair exonuclease SbcCD ATPase subunit
MTDTPAEVAEALELADMLQTFAYEQGFHECGYDPIKRLRARITELERQLAEARECIDNLKYRRETADAFGEQCMADIADLQSQLAAQRERDGRDAERMARWITRHVDDFPDWIHRDHACAECVSDGEMVQPGFRCAVHTAAAIDAALKDRP